MSPSETPSPPSDQPDGPDEVQRAGPLLYGGIGWALDSWLGTAFLLPVGIVGGVALSLYLIWFRYGSR